jgi:hypothetical protein
MTRVEENFQPQVRDTTNGPNVHTYIPRGDGTIMVGDVIYIPQTTAATAATTAAPVTFGTPVTFGAIPTSGPQVLVVPSGSQPFVVAFGGSAVPSFNVSLLPQYHPYIWHSSAGSSSFSCRTNFGLNVANISMTGLHTTNCLPSARGLPTRRSHLPLSTLCRLSAIHGPASAFPNRPSYFPDSATGLQHHRPHWQRNPQPTARHGSGS